MKAQQLLRIREVMARTGLCRSAIYALQKDGDFPAAIKISARSVAWPSGSVDRWIAGRIKAAAKAA